MATIKSHTDIEQSRKLEEILPIESADMYYAYGATTPNIMIGSKEIYYCYPICWSLAALLSVLPNNENINTNLSKGGYRISTLEYTNSWFVDYEDEINGLNNCVTSADNPVDAAVEMIIKLNKLKQL